MVMSNATAHYEQREEEMGADTLRQVERQVMLRIIDQRWREHLEEMDYLQGGINLRAMGQKDPLVEWQREGFEMFGTMMTGIAQDFVKYVMHVQVVKDARRSRWWAQRQQHPFRTSRPARLTTSSRVALTAPHALHAAGAPATAAEAPEPKKQETVVKDAFEKTPRNAPCPCGSGKKFKNCHGEA